MKFALLGWNFHQTPVELREQIALSAQAQSELALRLRAQFPIKELLILSTCNRTEFYFVGPNFQELSIEIKKTLIEYWGAPELETLAQELYDLDAVNHLFRVASSLDSMVLGEPQILGQLKDSYHRTVSGEHHGKLFKSIFPKAFSAAKRVRNETSISHFAVSISYAAVELAKHIFRDLSQQTVMIIGAGEMAELAAKHLIRNGISRLLVTNRTFSNAVALAEKYQASAIRFEQLQDYLVNADIIISSTGAKNYVISAHDVEQSLKKRKGCSMFFIDIAVPRDIDPKVNKLPGVFCYDIDDLENVVNQNRQERQQQAELAEQIITEETTKVHHWFRTLSSVPSIRSLRQNFHQTAEIELVKFLDKLGALSPKQQDLVKHMVHSIINKLLHTPSKNLKQMSQRDDITLYLEAISEIFELNPTPSSLEEKTHTRPQLKLLKK